MNRIERYSSQPFIGAADRHQAITAREFPRPPRTRRIRRHLHGYGSEVVWSLLTLILIVWMALIALTLWH